MVFNHYVVDQSYPTKIADSILHETVVTLEPKRVETTMSNQSVLRETSSNRQQPLLQSQSSMSASRLGEVVGGTTAECMAVACCCPCGIFNFLVLAIYKVPTGLYRRALRKKKRRRLMKEGMLPPKRRIRCTCGSCDENGIRTYPMCANDAIDIESLNSVEPDKEVLQLEEEMWDMFYSAGFWRSFSKRDPSSQTLPYSNVVPSPERRFSTSETVF